MSLSDRIASLAARIGIEVKTKIDASHPGLARAWVSFGYVDGQMVMKKSEDGIVVPAGKHEHLAPGGPHIMLMGLTRELPAGSEELACTLTFDDGQTIDILAPVKEFTEEQDTYHTHAPGTDS